MRTEIGRSKTPKPLAIEIFYKKIKICIIRWNMNEQKNDEKNFKVNFSFKWWRYVRSFTFIKGEDLLIRCSFLPRWSDLKLGDLFFVIFFYNVDFYYIIFLFSCFSGTWSVFLINCCWRFAKLADSCFLI